MNESIDAETADAETADAATAGAQDTGSARPGSGAEYAPSPSDRVRDQVALYEATNGIEGGEQGGLPVVILTTTGARSGKTRKNPVMRVEQDGVYAAIASYAGNPENPRWYYNLLAQPYATVQDGRQVRRVRAREVFDEEKQGWWAVADALNPNYARYRATAGGRDIPILALEPAEWADEVG
jgi:deazaflavin-dependent oxidoreductase (nitroreductase family)